MVTWHLTIKLFTAKWRERATLPKLWRQTGNSSLLPGKCWPLLHEIRACSSSQIRLRFRFTVSLETSQLMLKRYNGNIFQWFLKEVIWSQSFKLCLVFKPCFFCMSFIFIFAYRYSWLYGFTNFFVKGYERSNCATATKKLLLKLFYASYRQLRNPSKKDVFCSINRKNTTISEIFHCALLVGLLSYVHYSDANEPSCRYMTCTTCVNKVFCWP